MKLASQRGRVLRGANLFRADLAGAHLFNVDLQGADMLKTNLAGANLNEAKLQGVDLLGAALDGTRLERVQWGDACVNEQGRREALSAGRRKEALEKFEEAEEVYRILRQAYDGAGRFEQAGAFFRREMTMRRMLLPILSMDRLWSKVVDTFCARLWRESSPCDRISNADQFGGRHHLLARRDQWSRHRNQQGGWKDRDRSWGECDAQCALVFSLRLLQRGHLYDTGRR